MTSFSPYIDTNRRGDGSSPLPVPQSFSGAPSVKLSLLLGNDILDTGIAESLLENRKRFINIDHRIDNGGVILRQNVSASRILVRYRRRSGVKPKAVDLIALALSSFSSS